MASQPPKGRPEPTKKRTRRRGPKVKADGRSLVVVRSILQLEQREVASRAGLNPKKLGRLERGQESAKPADLDQIASSLGLPPSVFQEVEDFIRFVERLLGQGASWSGGKWTPPPPVDLSSEVAEPVHHEWIEALEDDRLAASAGRTVKELVYRLLRERDNRRY